MVEVKPIARTAVDWQQFLIAAKELLGRSLTAELDARNMRTDDLAAYIASLGELESEGASPASILRAPGYLLGHVSYSFLVVTDRKLLYIVAATSDLRIVGTERCAVISGSLEVWRSAIINGCTGRESMDLRLLYDKCLLYFERDGLGQLWSNYQKVSEPDRTFRLLEKR